MNTLLTSWGILGVVLAYEVSRNYPWGLVVSSFKRRLIMSFLIHIAIAAVMLAIAFAAGLFVGRKHPAIANAAVADVAVVKAAAATVAGSPVSKS